MRKHNLKWPQVSDYSCGILIIGSSGSEKQMHDLI